MHESEPSHEQEKSRVQDCPWIQQLGAQMLEQAAVIHEESKVRQAQAAEDPAIAAQHMAEAMALLDAMEVPARPNPPAEETTKQPEPKQETQRDKKATPEAAEAPHSRIEQPKKRIPEIVPGATVVVQEVKPPMTARTPDTNLARLIDLERHQRQLQKEDQNAQKSPDVPKTKPAKNLKEVVTKKAPEFKPRATLVQQKVVKKPITPAQIEAPKPISAQQFEHALGITPEDKVFIIPGGDQLVHKATDEILEAPTKRTNLVTVKAELNPRPSVLPSELDDVLAEVSDDVPDQAPDIQDMFNGYNLDFDFKPDTEAEPGYSVLESDSVAEQGAHDGTAESPENQQLLADWSEFIEHIEPADFTNASHSEATPDAIEYEDAELGAAETDVEVNNHQSLEAPVEIAEQAPAAVLAIEQITECIEALEPDAVTEVHTQLGELDQALQQIADVTDTVDASLTETDDAELATAQTALTVCLKKLCETLGLEYSEEQIAMIVEELISKHTVSSVVDAESLSGTTANEFGLDLSLNGTREALQWFQSTIKQFKKRTNWVHRFIGKYALAPIPDSVGSVVADAYSG